MQAPLTSQLVALTGDLAKKNLIPILAPHVQLDLLGLPMLSLIQSLESVFVSLALITVLPVLLITELNALPVLLATICHHQTVLNFPLVVQHSMLLVLMEVPALTANTVTDKSMTNSVPDAMEMIMLIVDHSGLTAPKLNVLAVAVTIPLLLLNPPQLFFPSSLFHY